jgi:hypothetical protein
MRIVLTDIAASEGLLNRCMRIMDIEYSVAFNRYDPLSTHRSSECGVSGGGLATLAENGNIAKSGETVADRLTRDSHRLATAGHSRRTVT